MNGKKVVPQVIGGALAIIGVWAIGQFAKIAIPPEVAVAIGTVMAWLVSMATPDEMESE